MSNFLSVSLMPGEYFVPEESNYFDFHPVLVNSGSGDWWIYGEDKDNYYYTDFVDKDKPYKMISIEDSQECSGFDKKRYDTWCNNPLKKSVILFKEINDPGYLFPKEVVAGQRKIFFEYDEELMFAIVLKPSFNIPISFDPDVKSDFSGVFVADQVERKWDYFLEINETDITTSAGNNPYYLWMEDNDLYLNIVDVNGAGSGEGIMKVFSSSKLSDSKWKLVECYYFVPDFSYNLNQSTNLFRISSKLSQYKSLDMKECDGDVEVIIHDSFLKI